MIEGVAVITGASRGIGSAIAIALAESNMKIVVNYLKSEDEAANLVEKINGVSEAVKVKADISNPDEVKYLLNESLQKFERVDILVNNAGAVVRPGDWQSITPDEWLKTIDINLSSVFYCTKAFSTVFMQQKSGKIINISSTYGITGAAPVIAYTAAKSGVINLTRSFAKELAPYITVNAVAPGNIDTDMTRGAGQEFIDFVVNETPLKRLGTPEDVANTVNFLASSKADFITGQIIVVDGGHMLR